MCSFTLCMFVLKPAVCQAPDWVLKTQVGVGVWVEPTASGVREGFLEEMPELALRAKSNELGPRAQVEGED